MEFIDLFPTTIYHKVLDFKGSELESFKNKIKSEEFIHRPNIGDYTKTQQLLDDPVFIHLKSNIITSAKKYLNDLGHVYEDLQIASSWSPIFKKGEGVYSHSHDNSYLSGVFYIIPGSDIIFDNPLYNMYSFKPEIITTSGKNRTFNQFRFPPSPNTLLLFPSFLNHSVEPSKVNGRMSIAFNIIPKGEFGLKSAKLYLK